MATRKRAKHRSSRTKKRGSASRRRGGIGAVFGAREVLSREVIGAALLVAGAFFTAAFLTGRGAFLGEAGLAASTYLLGIAGLALPPLAALAGLLMLLGRLPERRTLGVALLLIAVATTLAAFLPPESRFNVLAYPGYGGILGSALYAAVDAVIGDLGAKVAAGQSLAQQPSVVIWKGQDDRVDRPGVNLLEERCPFQHRVRSPRRFRRCSIGHQGTTQGGRP